ncbi:MAG: RecX family transcriptional regulator [Simkaniaceae bacterium]|nr:RecX family transcriptional regulator [Simkaniaceae bacterium]
MEEIEQKAFKLLINKDLFSNELETRLVEAGFEEDEVRSYIVRLKERGLINDETLLERFIDWYFKRGDGPELILMKLRQRTQFGVVVIEREKQVAKIQELMHKRRGDLPKKIGSFLVRKGFDLELVRELIFREGDNYEC